MVSSIVVLGLKVYFKDLWTEVGFKEYPRCACIDLTADYKYCPQCGQQNEVVKINTYKCKITGAETTYRSLDGIIAHLYDKNVAVYDSDPDGYDDDSIYFYIMSPSCFLEVSNTLPVYMMSMKAADKNNIKKMLKDVLGKKVWDVGNYGLWAFNKKSVEVEAKSDSTTNSDKRSGGSGDSDGEPPSKRPKIDIFDLLDFNLK